MQTVFLHLLHLKKGCKWQQRCVIGCRPSIRNIFDFFLFLPVSVRPTHSLRSWLQDYHKRATVDKSASICTQVCPINLKVSIKKREPPVFSIEICRRKGKKGDKPFNFIASRALKYSLRSTFHFQALCRRQESWHLCMLLLCTMLFSPQMCGASHPSTPSHRSCWRTTSFRPVQNGSAESECQLTVMLW